MAADALGRLRLAAEEQVRSGDWPGLLTLAGRLEQEDPEYWTSMWGPLCAVASYHAGDPGARDLLEACIAGGFHQPEFFVEEFATTFAHDEDWPSALARMAANIPPPSLELHAWPEASDPLLTLDRLEPAREERLRELLPAARDTAWETARMLLEWVHRRWRHANAHVENKDAVEVLERVEEGERFACVEYSIVLSQALNALGLPGRRVNLRTEHHHTGFGRGHVVSEAWVDDLGRWVLLDGQNGAYWVDEAGLPLGVVELQRCFREGRRPGIRCLGKPLEEADLAQWFWYFASASTTGMTWSAAPFVPVFQDSGVLTTDRLVQDPGVVAADLAQISTAVVEDEGPALRFTSVHPYAAGFVVGGAELGIDEPFSLELPPGSHELSVATRTRFAVLRPSALHVVVR